MDQMEDIRVPCLRDFGMDKTLDEIAGLLDTLERNSIAKTPWENRENIPDVSFVIAHTGDCILLKYYVHENSIRGLYSNTNAPVHEDSCVEFFIGFGNGPAYYNIELNCIGTCLLGYGIDRNSRDTLPDDIVNKIQRYIVIEPGGKTALKPVYWELTLVIPKEVFIHDDITCWNGMNCKVNFFKCGDGLPEPHFLSWNNIISPEPNFHLPEFFGNMQFI